MDGGHGRHGQGGELVENFLAQLKEARQPGLISAGEGF